MIRMNDNPPLLAPDAAGAGVASLDGPWWVAHTKARFEKAFAWDLIARSIPHFLPMLERVTVSGGRKRRGMAPLFPSYVFFCGNAEQRQAAVATNRICQVLPVRDRGQFVNELAGIERAINAKATIDFYPHAVVGRRVRVVAGPLEGVEGIVVRNDDVTRLVLHVTMLGRGASLEIGADLLEAAE